MRRLSLITAALLGAAGAQLAYRHFSARDLRAGSLPVGRRLDVSATSDASGLELSISDIGEGTCSYVVVATSTCPYCRSLATRWTVTSLNEAAGADLPEGWTSHWVMDEPLNAIESLFDRNFPAPTYHRGESGALIRRVGAAGVPYHLVIDRAGRVVAGGLGGELLPKKAFRPDCTLDESAQVAEFTPSR